MSEGGLKQNKNDFIFIYKTKRLEIIEERHLLSIVFL